VLVAVSKGMQAVKLCNKQNSPVLNWRCRLTHVDLYNGHKTIAVVAVSALTITIHINTKQDLHNTQKHYQKHKPRITGKCKKIVMKTTAIST